MWNADFSSGPDHDTRDQAGLEDPNEWVEVARQWTNLWDDIPINQVPMPDEKWYGEHYRLFRDKFPQWEYRMFTTHKGANDTDGTIVQFWKDGVDYFVWMEANDDAPFWLLTSYSPVDFDTKVTVYTNSGVE